MTSKASSAGVSPGAEQDPAVRPRDAAIAGVVTAAIAAVAAIVCTLVIGAAGTDLVIPASPGSSDLMDLGIGPVVIVTLLAVLVGAGVYWLLERFTRRPVVFWRAVVAVVAVVSLVPVFAIDAGTGNAVALVVLHLVVAAVAAVGMPMLARRRA